MCLPFIFQDSNDTVIRQIYDKLMAPYEYFMLKDDIVGLERVCGMEKYALVTDNFMLINLRFVPNCSVTYIPKACFPGSLAVALTQDSPYRKLFNQK
jgi:hypothetical protein